MAVAAMTALAQAPADTDEGVARAGPGVTPPFPIYKPDPAYSPQARALNVQGTAVFELLINE